MVCLGVEGEAIPHRKTKIEYVKDRLNKE